MVILRKLKFFASAAPSSTQLKKPLEDAKKENAKFLQNLQKQGLDQKTPITPIGDMRPGVVSAPKSPTFSNGADNDSLPEQEIDFDNGDTEDY
jgi:hypothetical protein